jgi:peptidoglycan hydrolase-like protein with peptidoglycan-binding domain
MRSLFSIRQPVRRTRSWLAAAAATGLALVLAGTLISPPAYAANPVTPGNYRGLGFDQCEAPSASAMSTWIKKSPFRAAGIYISGASRACQRQSNLTASWVRWRLAEGWHLMPITLGPQASCSHRYPRYGKNIDPTINPNPANYYAAAKAQGRLEAQRAVSAARRLGLVPGSTIFYDLEAFDIRRSTSCTQSAIRFMHAWTNALHGYGYASGYYSSAASGIRMLDDERVRKGSNITMPDQVWIADWNGKANTSSSYIRSDGWQPYGRAKQFQGGHNETWGGVRINIDRNYLNLRTPRLPSAGKPTPPPSTPSPTPAPTSPRYTGTSLADPKCSPATINRTSYRATGATSAGSSIVPLQCLLKQQRLYRYSVTGTWNPQTQKALNAFQKRVGHPTRTFATRSNWMALATAGSTGRSLRSGSRGADVTMLQRALNAAGSPALKVSGVYDAPTASAVGAYQRSVSLSATKIVGVRTWKALRAGRR